VVTNVSVSRPHPQRVGVAIAGVDAERHAGLRLLPGLRLYRAAHLTTDLLQDQRALALERSLRAGLAEGARGGDIRREEPGGDDRREHGGDEQLDEREASLIGHGAAWLGQDGPTQVE